ncbi:hypothetical protein B0H11DRAFT_1752326 [Mycena galericulata]|nr:hypothetical protein B0H11DRAFT_1752326 [Mycena galericulata]
MDAALAALRTGSSGFILTSSPIRSTSHHTSFAPQPISPQKQAKIRYAGLLETVPSTVLEENLQAALREVLAKNAEQKSQMITMQSCLVLNGAYCDVVRGQLAAQEESRKKKAKGRLVGDGLPRLLTSADFVERVIAFHDAAKQKAADLETRKATRNERSSAMEEWKALEADRKARNEEIRVQWKSDVEAWEVERDRAKALHKRAAWKKPSLKGLLFSPVPKPTFISEPTTPGNDGPGGGDDPPVDCDSDDDSDGPHRSSDSSDSEAESSDDEDELDNDSE